MGERCAQTLLDVLSRVGAPREAAPLLLSAAAPSRAFLGLWCVGCGGVPLNAVTAPCGHTACRGCSSSECPRCGARLDGRPATNVLVQSLVNRWWPSEIHAARARDGALDLLRRGDAVAALALCDESLNYAPQNHVSLCLRSRVLLQLQRPGAALVDADTALRLRPLWGKAHYSRGLALCSMGRYEEALVSLCACAVLERDVRRALHRLLRRPKDMQISTGLTATLQENDNVHALLQRVMQDVEKISRQELKLIEPHVERDFVDSVDFDCVLCCRTLWKPVTTPCGHTYCQTCLDRCLDYSFSCPLCMTSLADYILSNPKCVTEFVEHAMKTLLPREYSMRQLVHCQELWGPEKEHHIPVFVCTTAFPTVPCPLYVYEPRYRVMVRRCVEAGTRQFGIAACVNKEAGHKSFSEFGTMLEIRDWVLLSDGCSIITTVGVSRFRVLSRGEKDGYDTAQVEFLKDTTVATEDLPKVRDLHERVRQKGWQWFESMPYNIQAEIVTVFGEMPPIEDDWVSTTDGPAWSWWLLAILPLRQHQQVGILGTTSLEKRLRAIDKILDQFQCPMDISDEKTQETTDNQERNISRSQHMVCRHQVVAELS